MPPNARSIRRTIIALTIITVAVGRALAVSDDSSDKHAVHGETATTTAATTERSRDEEEVSSVDYEDEDEGDEDNDDNEGEQEDVDEYEEELRGIAESHEAMSRDNRANSTDGVNQAEINVSPNESQGARNFDSHEKSLEESSDESMTSNEAISSEVDTEVITNPPSSGEKTRVKQLSKFKRQAKLKTKREPTVKKELSSQKEIQGSETKSNKSTTSVVSELNGESMGTQAREMVGNELLDNEDPRAAAYIERRSVLEKDFSKDEYKNLKIPTQILRKIDKRQQLKTYFPPTHIRDRGKKRKLEELGTEEHVVAESLVKLLVRLLENPRRWRQAHRLLNDVENDLENPPLDSSKRAGYYVNHESPNLPTEMPEIAAAHPSTKKPKKKKKKKKKPRYESTTSNAIPLTPAVPTSRPTEATTEKHWRLVAEHLFRPWPSQSDQKKPSNLAKIHYALPKDKTPRNHLDESSQYLNDDIPTLESSRKYPLWRKFHFGKINTHEKGSPLNQHNSEPVNYATSDTLRTIDQAFDYEAPEHDYHRSRVNEDYDRYEQYDERARGFDENDYQEMLPYPSEFSHALYPLKYSKYERRPVAPYFQSWNARYRPRMWQAAFDDDQDSRLYRKFNPWEEKSMRSWRPAVETRPKYSSDKHKNRSELNEALKTKEDDNSLPKISMKTWNSLTSDPATWPYKLAGAKPWPKDKDGKSYNPNADLVRKLGLDQQTRLDKGHGQEKAARDKDSSEKSANLSDGSWSSEQKIWPMKMSPKIHSVGVWVVPVDQSTWKPYDPKQRQAFENPDSPRWSERGQSAWSDKLTDWNGFSKQTSQSGTWTPKWKQFSYHKVNNAPMTKSGASLEGTPRTRNSFIAVSAVSPSKYSGNEWRKNDIEEVADEAVNSLDKDDPTSQLLHQDVKWKHGYRSRNHTDSLEHQLEELEQHNNLEKRSPSTEATYLLYVDRKVTTTPASVVNDESTLKSIQRQSRASEESVKK